MQYYSTNGAEPVGFREAVIQGMAPDGGLYFPEHIPIVSPKMIADFRNMNRVEIAASILQPFVGDDLSKELLIGICDRTLDFPIPLVQLDDNRFVLELFHGPTLAFKDIGARFLSNCLQQFIDRSQQKHVVVVATSGDTGGAVASSFVGIPGIDVVVLFPKKKVSVVQLLQLGTLGKNIHALEVDADFDACQQLAKTAFSDPTFSGRLLSANSINIARWLPQQLYYWFAFLQWKEAVPPLFVVPSGNLGNLCAGLLAHIGGMPASGFVAACNRNDTIPDFLASGVYTAKSSQQTLSNAMDVGDPNNFQRLVHLARAANREPGTLVSGYSITDEQTEETIRNTWDESGYRIDPHTAVGLASFERYRAQSEHRDAKGIVLSTAHPVKFRESVEAITEEPMEVPDAIRQLYATPVSVTPIPCSYKLLKEKIRSLL